MHIIMRGLAAAAALGAASSASAGVYSDDLGRCLVAKTTEADKTLLIQWIFSTMSVHPAVKHMAPESPEQRRAVNRKAGQVFERMMTSDCRAETVAELRYEGLNSLQAGFGILSQAALAGMLSDPAVLHEIQELTAVRT